MTYRQHGAALLCVVVALVLAYSVAAFAQAEESVQCFVKDGKRVCLIDEALLDRLVDSNKRLIATLRDVRETCLKLKES